MTRLMSKLPTVNLINYMADGFSGGPFQEASFLGFLPITGEYSNWGVEIDGQTHCAVHLFRTIPGFVWGDDPKDTAENAIKNPWVLMFYGSDNSSCMIRFPTRKVAEARIAAMKSVSHMGDPDMMYYNS